MKILSRKNAVSKVEFCDRCGSVCDERCRADAERSRVFELVLRNGSRL